MTTGWQPISTAPKDGTQILRPPPPRARLKTLERMWRGGCPSPSIAKVLGYSSGIAVCATARRLGLEGRNAPEINRRRGDAWRVYASAFVKEHLDDVKILSELGYSDNYIAAHCGASPSAVKRIRLGVSLHKKQRYKTGGRYDGGRIV